MVIGHQKQRDFLKQLIVLDKIPHAFLFFGEARIGKKKTALEFVKLMNCESGLGKKPCQNCYSCKSIENFQHPDFIFIEAKEKEIQISQIRDIGKKLLLKPSQFKSKVVIIDDAHLMNTEAQGALLKTLEEPRGNAILILITEHPEMLLETIISRIQKIKFNPIKKEEIEKYLGKNGLSKEKINMISFLSLGKPGLAIDFILNEEVLQKEIQKLKDLISIIATNDLALRFQYAKKITTTEKSKIENLDLNNKKLKELLESWLNYFRDFLLMQTQAVSENNFYGTMDLKIDKILKKYSLSRIIEIIKTIQKIIFSLSTTNSNQRLALEIIMLEL